MRDFHNEQFDPRTGCSGADCACASAGMAIFFGTRGHVEMSHADVRAFSGVSCIPGRDTPSGGLYISHVEKVCKAKGVTIDYGRAASSFYRRWNTTEIRTRLGTKYGAILLGMYQNVPAPWRANGSTFGGGHSVWTHDYREDLPDSHYDKVQPTVCWHDPLRKRPIRVPWSVVVGYTQASTAIKGFAGWVEIPPVPGGTYAKPLPDRTRAAYPTLAVHNARTVGVASTVRVIRRVSGQPKPLVQLYMYAPGETYKGSNQWGALSLLGNEWVHVKRLDHVGGTT